MDWIKSGHWALRDIGTHPDGMLWAVTDITWVRKGMKRLEGKIQRRRPNYLGEPDRWWNEIGEPSGFQRYRLTKLLARAFLSQVVEVTDHYSDDAGFPRSQRDLLITGLLELLTKFGPLVPIEKLALGDPAGNSTNYEVGVDLERYLMRLLPFTAMFIKTLDESLTSADRLDLAAQVLHYVPGIPGDIRVAPKFSYDGHLQFATASRTLLGYTWLYLAESLQRSSRGVCPCGKVFQIEARQGRPFKFCEQCRNPAARQRHWRDAHRRLGEAIYWND